MNTGKALAERRIKLKLTQQQIAEKLGVGQYTISRIENGNNDRYSLHIAYNGLLNELEQAFINIIELAIDYNLQVPEEDYILYTELIRKGVNNGTKES